MQDDYRTLKDHDDANWHVTYTLVFRDMPPEEKHSWFWRLLKRGFEHVEVWAEPTPGVWVRIDPCIETVVTEVLLAPAGQAIRDDLNVTTLRVERQVPKGKVREWCAFGPVTCVELAKAFVGYRNFFVRTPYQLYKVLRGEASRQRQKV